MNANSFTEEEASPEGRSSRPLFRGVQCPAKWPLCLQSLWETAPSFVSL